MTEQLILDLAAIEARANAATEGPLDVILSPAGDYACINTAEQMNIMSTWNGTPVLRVADAEFIAHARTDVPALLALVREQQARIDRALSMTSTWEETALSLGSGAQEIRVQFAVTRIRAALTATKAAK